MYRGEELNGIPHGKGESKFPDGSIYVGDVSFGLFQCDNGKIILYYLIFIPIGLMVLFTEVNLIKEV